MRVQTYSSQSFFKNVLYYEHDAGVTMVAFLCKQIDHFLKFVHQVVDYNQIAVFFGQSFYEFRVYFLVRALPFGIAPAHFTRVGKNQIGSEQFSYKNHFPTTRRPGDYASEGAFQTNVHLFQIHPTCVRVCRRAGVFKQMYTHARTHARTHTHTRVGSFIHVYSSNLSRIQTVVASKSIHLGHFKQFESSLNKSSSMSVLLTLSPPL